MRKVALALMVLMMVGVVFAEGSTCSYCETSTLNSKPFPIIMAPASIILSTSEDTYFVCSKCYACCVGEEWYTEDEWIELRESETPEQKKEVKARLDERLDEAQKRRVENRIILLQKEYGWTKKRAERVANGYIYIGDTKTIVLEAWGKPKDINTTTTRYSVSEQWVYYNSYVYFENGVVTAIQN